MADTSKDGIFERRPQCCPVHKAIPKRKRHINTDRWKFPTTGESLAKRPETDSRIDLQPGATHREKESKKIETVLDEIKMQNFAEMLASCMDPETAENVATVLGISFPLKATGESDTEDASFMKKACRKEKKEQRSIDELSALFKQGKSGDDSDIIEVDNMYASLLKRIDKSEKEKKEADPEALAYKLVEEQLDKTAEEFCKWTACLLLPTKGKDEDNYTTDNRSGYEMAIKPEKLRELFQIDLCQSTLCPYIPLIIQEARDMPQQTNEKQKSQKARKVMSQAVHKKPRWRQAYYIPPTEWFGDKAKEDTYDFTEEEEDFIKSFGFQHFMKYLDQKGEPPPKVFADLKERYKEKIRRARMKTS